MTVETFVQGDLTAPCLEDNIWDRWSVIVIPREAAWADHWEEIARRISRTVGGRADQLVWRFSYDGDRSGYRISDFWGCTSRPPTQAEAEACFAELIATDWVDVIVSDCGQPIPALVGPPTAVAVSAITDTTATVSWTAPSGQVDGYSYVVRQGATVVTSGDVAASPANLTGLTAATDYTVTVTAKRGTQEASAAPVAFTTTGGAGLAAATTATARTSRKAAANGDGK